MLGAAFNASDESGKPCAGTRVSCAGLTQFGRKQSDTPKSRFWAMMALVQNGIFFVFTL